MNKIEFSKLSTKEDMILAFNQLKDDYRQLFAINEDLQEENERLNNVINELEKFFKYEFDNEVRPLNDRKISVWTICLDKLKELKEGDNMKYEIIYNEHTEEIIKDIEETFFSQKHNSQVQIDAEDICHIFGYIKKLEEGNERLKNQNNDLRKIYKNTYNRLFQNGNDELARYFQAQIDDCPTFYVEPIIDYVSIVNELEKWLKEENKFDEYKDITYRETMGCVLDKLKELKESK